MIESRKLLRAESGLSVRRGAKAKVSVDGSVLLVKEAHDDGTPFWTLPGGGLEYGESHVDALRRELREELDCEVRVNERIDTVWYAHRSTSDTVSTYRVFDCDVTSEPVPNSAEGLLAYRWVSPSEFPPRTVPQVKMLCG